jgi:hypothetical protein
MCQSIISIIVLVEIAYPSGHLLAPLSVFPLIKLAEDMVLTSFHAC